jgi:hypothetical protein
MNANPASMADTIGPGAFSTMLNRNTPEQELKNRFAQLCVDIIVLAQDLEESGDKIEPLSTDLRAQVQQLGDASAELAATIRLRLS